MSELKPNIWITVHRRLIIYHAQIYINHLNSENIDTISVYVHLYAAYNIRQLICDCDLSHPSHLCLVVYMYPTADT